MATLELLLLAVFQFICYASAQESINAAEGFSVWKQAGLAIFISFSILGTFAIVVNLLKKRYDKKKGTSAYTGTPGY